MAQLVTGLLLVWLLELNLLETSWLLLALALYLVVALTGVLVYGPALRRQVELAERLEVAGVAVDGDPALTAGYAAAARRSNMLGIAVTLIVVVIVVLMVAKPALW